MWFLGMKGCGVAVRAYPTRERLMQYNEEACGIIDKTWNEFYCLGMEALTSAIITNEIT